MPSAIQVNSDQTRIEVSLSGNVTGKEIIFINDELSNYIECISQIWNFLEAKTLKILPEEMHQIALQDRTLSLNSKIQKVAIVGKADVLHGLDEIYEIISGLWVGRPNHFISRTFTSMKEANEWIHIDEE